jgi:hypothetical protein
MESCAAGMLRPITEQAMIDQIAQAQEQTDACLMMICTHFSACSFNEIFIIALKGPPPRTSVALATALGGLPVREGSQWVPKLWQRVPAWLNRAAMLGGGGGGGGTHQQSSLTYIVGCGQRARLRSSQTTEPTSLLPPGCPLLAPRPTAWHPPNDSRSLPRPGRSLQVGQIVAGRRRTGDAWQPRRALSPPLC